MDALFLLIFLLLCFVLLFVVLFSFVDADISLFFKKKLPENAFEDKVVWITGASQGIGEMLAMKFSSMGARLILSSRNESKLNEVKSKLKGKHTSSNGVFILPLDLSENENELMKKVKIAENEFKKIDILIHNASFPRPKMTCLESSEELLKSMFEVNVFGTISLTKCILKHMLDNKSGHIVVVSSIAGKVPSPTQAIYSASKFALNGYFHTLAYELVGKGVDVSVICPGPIATTTPRKIKRKTNLNPNLNPNLELNVNKKENENKNEDTVNDDNIYNNNDDIDVGNIQNLNLAVAHDEEEQKSRMTCERCVDLMMIAIHNKMYECWISKQPVLFITYIAQYCPLLAHWIMKKVGPKRVKALYSGEKDLYNSKLFFSSLNEKKSN